jgi:hypothetical protein
VEVRSSSNANNHALSPPISVNMTQRENKEEKGRGEDVAVIGLRRLSCQVVQGEDSPARWLLAWRQGGSSPMRGPLQVWMFLQLSASGRELERNTNTGRRNTNTETETETRASWLLADGVLSEGEGATYLISPPSYQQLPLPLDPQTTVTLQLQAGNLPPAMALTCALSLPLNRLFPSSILMTASPLSTTTTTTATATAASLTNTTATTTATAATLTTTREWEGVLEVPEIVPGEREERVSLWSLPLPRVRQPQALNPSHILHLSRQDGSYRSFAGWRYPHQWPKTITIEDLAPAERISLPASVDAWQWEIVQSLPGGSSLSLWRSSHFYVCALSSSAAPPALRITQCSSLTVSHPGLLRKEEKEEKEGGNSFLARPLPAWAVHRVEGCWLQVEGRGCSWGRVLLRRLSSPTFQLLLVEKAEFPPFSALQLHLTLPVDLRPGRDYYLQVEDPIFPRQLSAISAPFSCNIAGFLFRYPQQGEIVTWGTSISAEWASLLPSPPTHKNVEEEGEEEEEEDKEEALLPEWSIRLSLWQVISASGSSMEDASNSHVNSHVSSHRRFLGHLHTGTTGTMDAEGDGWMVNRCNARVFIHPMLRRGLLIGEGSGTNTNTNTDTPNTTSSSRGSTAATTSLPLSSLSVHHHHDHHQPWGILQLEGRAFAGEGPDNYLVAWSAPFTLVRGSSDDLSQGSDAHFQWGDALWEVMEDDKDDGDGGRCSNGSSSATWLSSDDEEEEEEYGGRMHLHLEGTAYLQQWHGAADSLDPGW